MCFSPIGFHSRMLKSPPVSFSCRSEAWKHWRVFSVRQEPLYGRMATQSAVGTSSPLCSLRPCLGNSASRCARVGRVRSLAFLNILLTLLTVEYESIHA